MTGLPRDRNPEPLGLGGIAVLALLLAGSVLLVAVPLAVGLGAAVAIPGLGDFKPGVLAWGAVILIGFLLAWLVAVEFVEFVLRSFLPRDLRVAREALSLLAGLAVLTGLFSLVVTSTLTALVAAVIASLVLFALKPVIDRLEANAPR
ncbi:MAG: hypothetical protein L0H61_03590 [Micrococcaceae bacterium]|nr:hypothetical protein [Micrococcaceae bacterium]MDN5886093.1 hypothetical protein [Micrococcaceae bacterium]